MTPDEYAALVTSWWNGGYTGSLASGVGGGWGDGSIRSDE
jgi:hypothetical protein